MQVSVDAQLPVNIKAGFITYNLTHPVVFATSSRPRPYNCLDLIPTPADRTRVNHLTVCYVYNMFCRLNTYSASPMQPPHLPTVMAHLFSCCYINHHRCLWRLSFDCASTEKKETLSHKDALFIPPRLPISAACLLGKPDPGTTALKANFYIGEDTANTISILPYIHLSLH